MKTSFLFLATFVYLLPSTIMCLEDVPQDLIDTGKSNGIDANRIIVVGNGNTKMVADPNGADAELNRRMDIFFKTIES